MATLQQALDDLRALNIPLNPPATVEELDRLQTLAVRPLPIELRKLYQHHNGHELTFDPSIDDTKMVGLLFRLLRISEVIPLLEEMRQEWFADTRDLLDLFLPCWSDDNGNYMILYVIGPLAGRVAYLDHEFGFTVSPRFRDLASYYTSLIQAAQANSYDLVMDYPALQENLYYDVQDADAFNYCMQHYHKAQDENRRLFYAYNALYLCPLAKTSDLYTFLAEETSSVQGEVCEILAARNWTDAIPRLGEVVLARRVDSFVLAIEALGAIRDPAAAEELVRITARMHPYDLLFVVTALKNHGYAVQAIPASNGKYDTYQVRRLTDQEWIAIRGYDVEA